MLAPFGDFDQVMAAVPKLISSGLNPTIVEYIDNIVMAAIVNAEKLELGIPPEQIRDMCAAYLVVALENNHTDRLDEDAATLGGLLSDWGGALDAYVLQGNSARRLIVARENVFWTAKAIGADDIIDVVVPPSLDAGVPAPGPRYRPGRGHRHERMRACR